MKSRRPARPPGLIEQYKRRLFVDEELWAGKIGRAVEAHPGGISAEVLAQETGLDQVQIERADTWNNVRFMRQRGRRGGGPGPAE